MAEQHRKLARGKQPISSHSLFPVTVALWFGALLALASLALAPPLGASARILLALAMFAAGGLIAAVFARRIADSGRTGAPADHDPAKGSEAENPLWSELKRHRRALTGQPPSADESIRPAGREPQFLDVANVAIAGADGTAAGAVEKPHAAEPGPSGGDREAAPSSGEADAGPAMAEARSYSYLSESAGMAAGRLAKADLSELSHVELLERLALSLQRRNLLARAEAPRPADGGSADWDIAASDAPDEKDEVLAEGYSSLLSLGRPAADSKAAHVEEPSRAGEIAGSSALQFPGQAERRQTHHAAPVPAPAAGEAPAAHARAAPSGETGPKEGADETERALREALAALQKMSGTA